MTSLLLILTVALLLDGLIGDPQVPWHPVALLGRLAGWVEKQCRRLPLPETVRGFIGWLVLTFSFPALAWVSVALCGKAAAMAAGCWIYLTIAPRSLLEHAAAVQKPLAQGQVDSARSALARIVSRETATLPPSEIARGAIESTAENLVDAVLSALFWAVAGFVVAGAPGAAAGAVLLRVTNTLDACWGYRDARYLRFGRVAARADDVAHWLPARLSLPAIAIAAALTGGNFTGALRLGYRHRRDHPSPNSAWSMAAFAGALGIRLGGPTRYGDGLEAYPYYGNGRHELTAKDITRAERLSLAAFLVYLILLIAFTALTAFIFGVKYA